MTIETFAPTSLTTEIDEKIPILEIVEAVPRWQAVADRRRNEIQSALPVEYIIPQHFLQGINRSQLVRTSRLLSSRELSIVSLTATKLLEAIHAQKFSALEVTRAFCKSAAIAHQAVCFLNAWGIIKLTEMSDKLLSMDYVRRGSRRRSRPR